ncbi:alpha/beta fold hydrolase, partial [Streptomyces sp. NPDC059083]|uniref:alpha/beta fold hydrolase n=1 Tax=Streptomyces sp. NPDC059083 TaxID=3346721 RepID=UPI00367B237D
MSEAATAGGSPAGTRLHDAQVDTPAGRFTVRSVLGVADSEPIMLIHGMWSASFLWDDVLLALAEAGRFPVAVDILGHGRSQAPERLYTIADHADSLMTLADTVGWSRVSLVGNSMGSLIDVAAAARHPDRVAHLAVFGIPAWADEPARRAWLHERTGYIDVNTGAAQIRAPHNETPTGLALAENYPRIGIWILNSMWAIYAYDLIADLGRLQVPLHAW